MTERIDIQEFVGAFVVEAEEIVTTANAALVEIGTAIDHGTSRPRAVRDLFRALHTLKGLAGMMGVAPIVEIAHAVETLVRAADRAGGNMTRGALEVALQSVAAIAERVRAFGEGRTVEGPPPGLLEAISASDRAAPIAVTPVSDAWTARLSASEHAQVTVALQERTPVWSLTFTPSATNAGEGTTIASVRLALNTIGEIVKIVPRSLPAVGDKPPGVAFDLLVITTAPQAALATIVATQLQDVRRLQPLDSVEATSSAHDEADVSPIGRSVVRVELSRLDALQDQLSLLIVSRFKLDREIAVLAEQGHDTRRIQEAARVQGRLLRDLRRAILRARLVKVSEILDPLALLVRSLARSVHRTVQLELDRCDLDAELDKAVADRLLPALVHLVRNAVDHAIETPEQRIALGKPATGTVSVSCIAVVGNHLEVVVSDDGRGIDRAAIARRAGRAIDDDVTLLEVLTTPGFTTRDAASTTSGRGLGMDIVRRVAVGDLGGEISMVTQLGVGTSFTLRVPVTIAVMDVFSFQCGPQAFVVPATAVDEIFDVLPGALVEPPRPSAAAPGALSLVERRGHAIPVVSLGVVLAIDSGANARKALVIRGNGHPIAFTVDRMIGRQEVVVRRIDDPLVKVPGIAGATDLGDGRPTLVLDLNELGVLARARSASVGMS